MWFWSARNRKQHPCCLLPLILCGCRQSFVLLRSAFCVRFRCRDSVPHRCLLRRNKSRLLILILLMILLHRFVTRNSLRFSAIPTVMTQSNVVSQRSDHDSLNEILHLFVEKRPVFWVACRCKSRTCRRRGTTQTHRICPRCFNVFDLRLLNLVRQPRCS